MFRRGAVYCTRLVVPPRLRPIIGKSDLGRSLKTKDAKEAQRLYPAWLATAQATIDAAEQELARQQASVDEQAAPFDPFGGMTQEEAETRQRQQWADAWKISAEDDRITDAEAWLAGLPDDHPAVIVRNEERARGDRYEGRYRRRKQRDVARPPAEKMRSDSVSLREGSEPERKGVYLDTDIVDGWAAERKPTARGKDAYWRDAKLFNTLMGRKSVELITKTDVMAYKRLLIADPKRSQVNVRDRLAYLRTLLEWAAQNDVIADNPARDVKMAVKEKRAKRKDFSADDLNALFACPVHALGQRPKGSFGEAAYWLPLVAIYMGARREEIGQLRVSDVRLEAYIDEADERREAWCIDVIEMGDDDDEGAALPTAVKNEASMRLVPIHPKLIELGFVDYVQNLPDQSGRVFPELKPVGIGQKLTDKWGQWFTKYKRACGITDKLKVFHSLRHTWKTHAGNMGMPERVQRQFMGHEGKDAAEKYGSAPAMHVLVAAIASYRVPGLKL
ncbi:site-specific integrase [Sphingobium sufflavum]|uniref:site-specific integrase n=1 Tax=Sphingobium sufflavum TaxID=1129547 RepID=UPI001F286F60|nr:site-specific integrase [Sphingobium sufflavum]